MSAQKKKKGESLISILADIVLFLAALFGD